MVMKGLRLMLTAVGDETRAWAIFGE